MIKEINLKDNRILRNALRDAILNEIERLIKRNKKIINSKTYKEKLISNIRDNDFLSLKLELKRNKLYINALNKLLE